MQKPKIRATLSDASGGGAALAGLRVRIRGAHRAAPTRGCS